MRANARGAARGGPSQVVAERIANLLRGGTSRGVGLEAAGHQRAQPRRERSGKRARPLVERGILVAPSDGRVLTGLAVEGVLAAAEQLVEHDPEGPHIHGSGQRRVAPLLRRHVARGTRDGGDGDTAAADGIAAALFVVGADCQAEVEHAHAAIGTDEHVVGLEIAMQNTLAMRCAERLGDGLCHAHLLVQAARLVLQPSAHGAAAYVLERQVGTPAVLADGVDGHDVGMIELGGRARFGEEAAEGTWRLELAPADHLDGHVAVEGGVAGQVDLSHSPTTQQPHDGEVIDALAHHE